MSKQTYFLFLAAILIILVPFVPQLIRVRIAILRKIRFNWLADLNENNFKGFVLAARIILLGIAVIVVALAFSR